jgi:hypothetical protein
MLHTQRPRSYIRTLMRTVIRTVILRTLTASIKYLT